MVLRGWRCVFCAVAVLALACAREGSRSVADTPDGQGNGPDVTELDSSQSDAVLPGDLGDATQATDSEGDSLAPDADADLDVTTGSDELASADADSWEDGDQTDALPEVDVVLADVPRLYTAEDGGLATSEGQRLFLRGLNVDNQAKYSPGFLPPISDDEIARLPSQGINLVRLLTFWNAIAPDGPDGYDDTYIYNYVALVHKVADQGMMVVVDMHQDLWGPPFEVHGAPSWACPDQLKEGYVRQEPWWANYLAPQVTACFDQFWASEQLQEQYAANFAHLAQQVCDVPGVVGFDLMNEPFGGSLMGDKQYESTVLFNFYKRVVRAIEQVCPGRLYFLEHSWTFSTGIYQAMPLEPALRKALVFSPHYYRPELHELSGAGYTLTQEQLFSALDNLWGKYLSAGWSLWLGEFGGHTHLPGYETFIRQMHAYFQQRNVQSALYGWGKTDDGFAFVDQNGQRKPVFDAVYGSPYPTRLPGLTATWQADYDLGQVQAVFQCSIAAQALWLLPSGEEGCSCTVEPPDRIVPSPIQGRFQTWTCLEDGLTQMTCECEG